VHETPKASRNPPLLRGLAVHGLQHTRTRPRVPAVTTRPVRCVESTRRRDLLVRREVQIESRDLYRASFTLYFKLCLSVIRYR
jgi:hypothetical protein